MAEIDIDDAAWAGLRIIRRHPGAILVWGLLPVVYIAIILAIFGGGLMEAISSLRPEGTSGSTRRFVDLLMSLSGIALLLIPGLTIISAVIQGAAIRAVLNPGFTRFAFLALGAQEWWLLATNIVLAIILVMAQFAITILLAPLWAATLLGQGHSSGQSLVLGLALVLRLIGLVVSVWLWLRLSLGAVESFDDRAFRLFESWNLTKGRVGPMFLAILLAFLVRLAVSLTLTSVMFFAFFLFIVSDPGLRDLAQLRMLPPAVTGEKLMPLFLLMAPVMVVVVGVDNALKWGVLARLYRQIRPEGDVSHIFF